jgi:hypothetical protein
MITDKEADLDNKEKTMEKINEMMEDEEVIGGYNDLPPHFKKISEKAFAQSSFFTYSPIKTEFRQVKGIGVGEGITSIWLYWFHGGDGIAIRSNYWKGKVYYYKFYICDHEYENIESRMCYSKSKCKKCGYVLEVDSSD